jgi:hypothetical protein
MPIYISQTTSNPLSRVFGVILALLTMVGAFFFGLVILVVVSGLGLLLYLGMRVRMWWVMKNRPPAESTTARTPDQGEVIDAEYTVISKEKD